MADSNNSVSTIQSSPNQPKTFLQQFQDYATTVNNHTAMLSEAEKLLSIMSVGLKGIIDEQKDINDQLQAMMLLAEENKPSTRENVINKIQELRIQQHKNDLDRDEKAGLIKKIDSIEDDKSIVVFDDSSSDLVYAYKPVSAFSDEVKPQLIGKKPGDAVGTINILTVYSLVEQNQAAAN